jgi:SnoaL-like domain
MTPQEIGQKLVELCKAGKNTEAMEALYAKDIVSVEAGAPPGKSPRTDGVAACLEKSKQFRAMHEIHGATIDGPFPHGDRFAVIFDYDLTRRPDNQRIHMKEVALYTVANDKIVREEFFYSA